jgi:hypothetical protein
MTLGESQQHFTEMVGKLILWTYQQPGLALTFGDAFRSPEQAKANAASGKGIVNSLHCERLAVDLNLFINGTYQSAPDAYKPLGDYWKTLGGAWGGDFTTKDANHFSLAYGGRK